MSHKCPICKYNHQSSFSTSSYMRKLHLATCSNDIPHVSLMSYTYLASTPFTSTPTIILTTLPSSQQLTYLSSNPNVSLLVHDWVPHRPPTLASSEAQLSSSPERGLGRGSALASLLAGMNQSELARISVSIHGSARILAQDSEEARWFKAKHKEHNTFGDSADGQDVDGDEEDNPYIHGQEVKVVVVEIKGGRISDPKRVIRDFSVDGSTQVNGI